MKKVFLFLLFIFSVTISKGQTVSVNGQPVTQVQDTIKQDTFLAVLLYSDCSRCGLETREGFIIGQGPKEAWTRKGFLDRQAKPFKPGSFIWNATFYNWSEIK